MNVDPTPRELVVLVRTDGTELLLHTASPDELPPLDDVPLATEPGHFGRTALQPAPVRSTQP